MNFSREINRLMRALLGAFAVMLLAAAYYTIVGQYAILQRDDNPRLVEAEQALLRGQIVDFDGNLLAESVTGQNNIAQRRYLEPATYSAVGYYSFRYGTGGVEAAYNDILSGSDITPGFNEIVLRQPHRGNDIQLTLRASVQREIYDAMQGRRGAVIVMSVPDGAVWALVSTPDYNPNTLDDEWDALIDAPGNPFFNRVLQGQYQPGTIFQLPMLADALTRGQLLSAQFPGGATPILVNGLILSCVEEPPQLQINLSEAYVYGCPGPFSQLTGALDVERLNRSMSTYRITNPPTLADFFLPEETTGEQETVLVMDDATLRENVLGQGDINLSPMAINSLTAAIANRGNAPSPYVLHATRPPGTTTWQPVRQQQTTLPYMTVQTAQQIGLFMRESVLTGTANATSDVEPPIRGQAAIAFSGEGALVWFTGFTSNGTEGHVVTTVVLEDTTDVDEATQVGRIALQAATGTGSITE
ncbi:MAG: penicillin-binding transpeptidase domain-containing protein [Chloroflexota bacterium]